MKTNSDNIHQSQEAYLTFAKQLAHSAGQRLLSSFGKSVATTKEDGTTVTSSDQEIDQFICEEIQARYPMDNILSEELLPEYTDNGNAVWIVDPIDGTTNFSQGLPLWGVSIARLDNGYPTIGVLYFPVLDLLCHAAKGQGAFENNKRISARRPAIVNRYSIFTCSSGTERHYKIRGGIRAKRRTFGSTIYELYLVACGNALFSILPEPRIWDIAAAWLIIEESGGAIDTMHNCPPFPLATKMSYASLRLPTLATASLEMWEDMYAAIRIK
jgi:myo-inositol-1(or 4)-monophosphatase